jgi:hypothetical protein
MVWSELDDAGDSQLGIIPSVASLWALKKDPITAGRE